MGFTTYNTVNYKYYSHQYDGGQHCDENNKPRRTEVRYIACTSSQAVRPSLLGDFIDLCGLRYRGEDLRICHHRLHSRSQEGRILQDYRDQSCETYGTLWVPHVIGTIVSIMTNASTKDKHLLFISFPPTLKYISSSLRRARIASFRVAVSRSNPRPISAFCNVYRPGQESCDKCSPLSVP